MSSVVRVSKFLSLVLRHDPERIGLRLDEQGWADIDELIAKSKVPLTRDLLDEVVRTNDKQRFAVSDDGRRIRANQGHSVEIDIDLPPVTPPEVLYHGTAFRTLGAIRAEGLKKMKRQYVHLSLDAATATKVGQRHGNPVVLTISAGDMSRAGYPYFRSDNGVWLTDHVPVGYIQFPEMIESGALR